MSGGISKLGAALIAVFAFCFVVVIADIFYFLWRRRRFQHQSAAAGETVVAEDSVYALSSKELLYFFCWKDGCRVEPSDQSQPPTKSYSQEDDELLKLQEALYGQSRILSTIKEDEAEEKEGLDRVAPYHFSSTEKEQAETTSVCEGEEEGVEDVETTSVTEVEVEVKVDEATPFSTPCPSPTFYTPPPSPTREELKSKSSKNSVCDAENIEFVSIDIDGV